MEIWRYERRDKNIVSCRVTVIPSLMLSKSKVGASRPIPELVAANEAIEKKREPNYIGIFENPVKRSL